MDDNKVLNNTVVVSQDYTLKEGESPNNLVLKAISEDGSITSVHGKYENGKFNIKATNLSTYVLVYEENNASTCTDCLKDETCPINSFSDTANDKWWHDSIHYCLDSNLMKGTKDTLFEPESHVTRGQLVTMLHRHAGEPVFMNDNVFSDVKATMYYEKPIAWANGKEIVKGYGSGSGNRFGPDDNITREQLAVILYRYADQYLELEVSSQGDLSGFGDAEKVSDYAVEAMEWACDVGILNGDNGNLKPHGNATRAEAAAMLYRFCENVLK